jgi:2-polyprenyl-6-methoxyphenol hydroxylase-like FAD-dependent oxidoreductase
MKIADTYSVVIIGAGLAGLSLARQLLLNSGKKILLLDKRAEVPPKKQKVGEATVQLSAYYFSKVLDLEEHLLREHFMKYNLRFYWKNAGRANDRYEDYSQAYIRTLSNIATYQLDRNKIEAELLRLNLESPNFTFCAPASDLEVALSDSGPHTVSFTAEGQSATAQAEWVVDTSGRGKFLARRLGLAESNPIRHGSSFLWVEGLVNIEKLTDLSPQEIRLRKDRAALGHLPVWLATNHFCGEGFWFWVIPLQGKTSLGLVYDNALIPADRVNTPQKLIEWVCAEFPLFARDLPQREILDHGFLRDFSYDCVQTISASRWALAGEAGRFTDPLYSPGGDLISLYNTLITDAILTADGDELREKCRLYEQLMRALYEAYVPSYAVSYDVLGDQEAMTLKYAWELAIYFSFYVFPFINDLFTDQRFIVAFFNRFARLGPLNRDLQRFISDYYQWKKREGKTAGQRRGEPRFNDFTELGPLRNAERSFYAVGVTVDEARRRLDLSLANLEEMARFIVAYISAATLGDERALANRAFVESIDLDHLRFDPDEMRERYARCAAATGLYEWSFDPGALRQFADEGAGRGTAAAGKGGD